MHKSDDYALTEWKRHRLVEAGIYRLHAMGFEDEAAAIVAMMSDFISGTDADDWLSYVELRDDYTHEMMRKVGL